jgi:ATP-dependent Clp protease adaptor protein ClpS
MTDTACDVITKVKVNTDLKRPPHYSVVFYNDETTSAEFVVRVIMEVFGHSYEAAVAITSRVDSEGSGEVVSGLSKELATHLKNLVIAKARAESFPLVAEIKEDAE